MNLPEAAWDEGGKRTVIVSFAVEVGVKDTRTSAEIAEAILAEYGQRGGDPSMFLEPKGQPPNADSEMDYLRDYGVPPEVTDLMDNEQVIDAATALRKIDGKSWRA